MNWTQWTQPLCLGCWRREQPDADPVAVVQRLAAVETCCECGDLTREGIYVRRDPRTVPYPREAQTR